MWGIILFSYHLRIIHKRYAHICASAMAGASKNHKVCNLNALSVRKIQTHSSVIILVWLPFWQAQSIRIISFFLLSFPIYYFHCYAIFNLVFEFISVIYPFYQFSYK
jgi:hypothetical protein